MIDGHNAYVLVVESCVAWFGAGVLCYVAWYTSLKIKGCALVAGPVSEGGRELGFKPINQPSAAMAVPSCFVAAATWCMASVRPTGASRADRVATAGASGSTCSSCFAQLLCLRLVRYNLLLMNVMLISGFFNESKMQQSSMDRCSQRRRRRRGVTGCSQSRLQPSITWKLC
jgi:hypothetical protein